MSLILAPVELSNIKLVTRYGLIIVVPISRGKWVFTTGKSVNHGILEILWFVTAAGYIALDLKLDIWKFRFVTNSDRSRGPLGPQSG